MNDDQKTGILIIIVAVSLIGVALLISGGWGIPGVPLFLINFYSESESQWVLIETGYVLAVLVLVVGYGVARYFSVIPHIIQKPKGPQSRNEKNGK